MFKNLEGAIVYDLEADGLLDTISKVHCICWKVLGSKTVQEAYTVDDFLS